MADTNNKSGKNSFSVKVSGFFDGVKNEFYKIVWPTKDDIIKQTTAVIVISVICGALIAALDYGFGLGINYLTNINL